MKMKKCPDCGSLISTEVESCPKCSCPSEYFTECEVEKPSADADRTEKDQPQNNVESKKKVSIEIPDSLRQDGGKKPIPKTICEDIHGTLKTEFLFALDFPCLMDANDAFLRRLEKELSFDYPVTCVKSKDILDYCKRIDEGNFNYPYVIVCADAVPNSTYSYYHYKMKDEIGTWRKSIKQYYNGTFWPVDYAPRIAVISDTESQIKDIIGKIEGLYKQKWTSVRINVLGDSSRMVEAHLSYDHSWGPERIAAKGSEILWKSGIIFNRKPFVLRMDEESGNIGYKPKEDYRRLQIAQYYDQIYKEKIKCEGDIRLYKLLLEEYTAQRQAPQDGLVGLASGFLKGAKEALGPSQNEDYRKLKDIMASNGTYDAELIEKAFPNFTVFYHNLPNDIAQRTNPDVLKNMLQGFMTNVQSGRDKILNELGIPKHLDGYVSDFESNLQSTKGIDILLKEMDRHPEKTISEVVKDYKEKREKAITEKERAEKANRENEEFLRNLELFGQKGEIIYDNPRDYEPYYDDYEPRRGHGIISTLIHETTDASRSSRDSREVAKAIREQTEWMQKQEKQRQKEAKDAAYKANYDRWMEDFHKPSDWAIRNLDKYKGYKKK